MITTFSQKSLKLCQRFSSVGDAIFRGNSPLGIRYASLTSNIERAARKSARIESSREDRFGRRSKNDRFSASSPTNRRYPPNEHSRPSPSRDIEWPEDARNTYKRRSYTPNQRLRPSPSRDAEWPEDSRNTDKRRSYTPNERSRPYSSRDAEWSEDSRNTDKRRSYTPNERSRSYPSRDAERPEDSRNTDKRRSYTPNERSRPSPSRDVEMPDDSRNTYQTPHWQQQRGHVSSKPGRGSGNIPRRRGKRHESSDEVPERVKSNVSVPPSVPYTTSASEFIYGLSAVEAALRCTRRKLYILYIYQSVDEVLSSEKVALRKLALARQLQVKMAFADWDRLLDKMSGGRPHNGCLLEASPLPQLPVTHLQPVSSPADEHFGVALKKQSLEEAAVNGSSDRIARVPRYEEEAKARFPLVLLLDGILDPGNLGAVIRSAYYMGVDALVLTGRNSAPMTPVTIKASAGAAENMTILKASNEIEFIRRSRENGWRFYTADSPENVANLAATTNLEEGTTAASSSTSLLASAPTVLMLGSEGTGLLARIKAQADGVISIPGARIRPELGINDAARVDSLNVSVAAALLIEMLLRVPLQVATLTPPSTSPEVSRNTPSETPPRSFDFN